MQNSIWAISASIPSRSICFTATNLCCVTDTELLMPAKALEVELMVLLRMGDDGFRFGATICQFNDGVVYLCCE